MKPKNSRVTQHANASHKHFYDDYKTLKLPLYCFSMSNRLQWKSSEIDFSGWRIKINSTQRYVL